MSENRMEGNNGNRIVQPGQIVFRQSLLDGQMVDAQFTQMQVPGEVRTVVHGGLTKRLWVATQVFGTDAVTALAGEMAASLQVEGQPPLTDDERRTCRVSAAVVYADALIAACAQPPAPPAPKVELATPNN